MEDTTKSESSSKRQKIENENSEMPNYLSGLTRYILIYFMKREASIDSIKTLIDDPDYDFKDKKNSEICHKYVEERFYIWSVQSKTYDQSSSFSGNLDFFKNTLENYAWDLLLDGQYIQQRLEAIKRQWYHEEKIACGILQQNENIAEFSDNILREYFAAGYVLRLLVNRFYGGSKRLCKALNDVLSYKNFEHVRMIMEEELTLKRDILENLNESPEKMKKIADELVDYLTTPTEVVIIYEEDLTNIIQLVNYIMQHGSYEKVSKFVMETFLKFILSIKTVQSFEIYSKFSLNFLNENDLKILLLEKKIFHELLTSDLFSEVAKYFTFKFDKKVDKSIIKQALMCRTYDSNILFKSLKEDIQKPKKFKILFEVLQIYCSQDEILSMVYDSNKNLIHELKHINNHIIFNEVIETLDNHFNTKIMQKLFEQKISYFYEKNNALMQFYNGKEIINDEETQVTFWYFVLKYYNTRKKLIKYITESYNSKEKFVHILVSSNSALTIRFTFNTLYENLTRDDYIGVITSQNSKNKNILYTAVETFASAEVFQTLWTIIKETVRNYELFRIILMQRDENGLSILFPIASFSSDIVFEFVMAEIKTFFSRQEIKMFLMSPNKWNLNLFQSAVRMNQRIKLHKALWKTFHEFFKPHEMVNFVDDMFKYRTNLMNIAVEHTTQEILEFTWNQIEGIMDLDQQRQYLKDCMKKSYLFNARKEIKDLLREKGIM